MAWTPTLRQLEYVAAVADTGGFGRAAVACAVSQPALSKQVREVEDGLGVILFERGPRGATPTLQGRALVERARRVLADARELTDAAAALRDPLAGAVRLGAIPTLAPFVLPGLVDAVRRDLPRLELRLVEEQTAELGDRLTRGELDVAVIALPYPRDGVAVRGLYEDPLVLVAPADHPLAGTRPLLRSELTGHRLLLLRQGHCLRDHVLQACPTSSAGPAAVEASSLGTLLLMVKQGLGVAVVPAMALPGDRTGLCVRPFAPPVPTRGVGLWWRPSSPRAALFERLGALLKGGAA
jgi:LysR family hydrogen peroxide-inducible transcriptional activator